MSSNRMDAGSGRTAVLWSARALVGLVGYGAVIFVSAGRIDWVWGWLLLLTLAAAALAPVVLLQHRDPALLAERRRGSFSSDVERWDRGITACAGGLMVLTWVVAGLDVRWARTGPVATSVHVLGLAAAAAGHGLFLWAMTSNPFFSQGVRIQEERGHTVATGGPYRWVRHPGYVGAIVAALGTPLLLGSIWALLPGTALVALLVLRAALEDRVLTRRLPGYAAYRARVPSRLLPGVW